MTSCAEQSAGRPHASRSQSRPCAPSGPCKLNLRQLTCKYWLSVNFKFLFSDAKLFESSWKFESQRIGVDFRVEPHLDFESYRYFSASARQILRADKIAYAVCSTRDFLQNFQRHPNGRLARTILPYQKDGRHLIEPQLEILQAPEIMDVDFTYHVESIQASRSAMKENSCFQLQLIGIRNWRFMPPGSTPEKRLENRRA